jgi:hypothetical protein
LLKPPCDVEVIALCKKSTTQGKKEVLRTTTGKNTGAASVMALWNCRTWFAASVGNVTGKSRSGRAIWISWMAGRGATSHDVYFGTNDPPQFIGNQTTTIFDPGEMDYSTTYYWRIDEVNSSGTTTGTVWSFTTLPSSPPPPPF